MLRTASRDSTQRGENTSVFASLGFGNLPHTKVHPDGIVIGESRGLDTRCQGPQVTYKDPIQVAAQRRKGVQRIGERRFEPMVLHGAANHRTMCWTSGQGQPVTQPVHVIGVEIAADQAWSGVERRLLYHRVELLETFSGVDPRIQMNVPKTQVSPRSACCGGERKTAPAAGTQIAAL
jgi:hypothetical protein